MAGCSHHLYHEAGTERDVPVDSGIVVVHRFILISVIYMGRKHISNVQKHVQGSRTRQIARS